MKKLLKIFLKPQKMSFTRLLTLKILPASNFYHQKIRQIVITLFHIFFLRIWPILVIVLQNETTQNLLKHLKNEFYTCSNFTLFTG